VAGATPDCPDYSGGNARRRVPQDHRPPRADKIDVLVAVEIEEIGTFPPSDKWRLTADRTQGPCRAVDSAPDETKSSLKGVLAARAIHRLDLRADDGLSGCEKGDSPP